MSALDHHLAHGRAKYDRVRAAGGDVMAAALAWISTSFDDECRADMLRERDERNRKMGEVA